MSMPWAIASCLVYGDFGFDIARLDTRREVEYYRHGGQLHYVVRDRLEKAA